MLELHTQAAAHPGLNRGSHSNEQSSHPPRAQMLTAIGAIDQYCRLLLDRVGPFTDPPGGQTQVADPVSVRASPQSALERVQAALRASNQWRSRAEDQEGERERAAKANALSHAMLGVRKALHASQPNSAVMV